MTAEQIILIVLGATATGAVGLAIWSMKLQVKLAADLQSVERVAEERKEEVNRRFNEVRTDNEARIARIEKSIADLNEVLNREFKEVKRNVTRVHERLDACQISCIRKAEGEQT